ncbi:MAG: tRNA (adenosine(37)-N6)-threonylcarbamoyltransferase complex transferase subunit TsaD [Parachlamydiales bacterium]|nr:tRNA (adenosine(37)-N6)-threonylcarbamoyltransferase complex transferase subunit TsaD [Parachlamydiales bacterium]
MIVLGIESTCDETGAAVVKDGKTILSNVLASSADIHEKYGGVFPELACRRHIEAIIPVVDEALKTAQVTPDQIDLIAVAKGPGLIGALLIGMNAAKGLSIAWNKPLVGVNHVEAHLYASMMELETVPLPALGIVISGGHTLLLKILELGCYQPISTTVDDAIGEAFDKVGNLLGLTYPGGPQVEKLARLGNPKAYPFTAGKVKRSPLDFSFSGLKTAVLYALKGDVDKASIAASFQETALRDIANKAMMASKSFDCQAIFLGGGVTANQRLKAIMQETFPHLPVFWPQGTLSLDNAAMIAGLGAKKFFPPGDPLDLEARTRIPIV